MSLFEDILLEEIARVFLNPHEFGRPLNVDGVETVGIFDEGVGPAEEEYGRDVETWGLGTAKATLCVPAEGPEAAPCPAPRQEMNIDGVTWTVRSARVRHGLLEIGLSRNED